MLLDVGLCISFYDFVEVGDPMVYPAEGGAHMQVKFRLVVFRPFPGEIIVGKVMECSSLGLKVSTGFFQDIIVPAHQLQNPSTFDENKQVWTWKYSVDGEDTQDFVIKTGNQVFYCLKYINLLYLIPIYNVQQIRIRVKTINFTSVKSTAKGIEKLVTSETHLTQGSKAGQIGDKGNEETRQTSARKRSSSISLAPDETPTAPMNILGSICEDGLGAVSWWQE